MEPFENDPVLLKYKFPVAKTLESDKKRLAALQEKIDQEKRAKEIVKNALTGQVLNKKIVFDHPAPKRRFDHEEAPATKRLFDDDDNDGFDPEKESVNFELQSKRLKGSKGAKLIQLQSRFAHDPRFKIDEKFVEDEDREEDAHQTDLRGHEDGEDNLRKESEKELDILEEVLGKPLKRKFRQPDERKNANSIIIPRYDPTKVESQKFRLRKVTKLEPYQLPNEKETQRESKPEISKERFYEISETFKKDFDEGQTEAKTFSLTALFGRPTVILDETEDDGPSEAEKRARSKKDSKKWPKDLEREADQEEAVEAQSRTKKHKKEKLPRKISEEPSTFDLTRSKSTSDIAKKGDRFGSKVSNPLLKCERFFFTQDDPRFESCSFYNPEIIKKHLNAWSDIQQVMKTSLTKKRRHYKHVAKLKVALESTDQTDKDLKKKYRIFKETTKKH